MPRRQHNLFETDQPPWELDAASQRCVATVVLMQGPPEPLSYEVPAALREQLVLGCRVRVPLGRANRIVEGWCVEIVTAAGTRPLKPIHELVDRRSLLSPALLRLTRWLAERYLCPWAQVLQAVIPAGVRGQAGTRLTTFLTVPTEVAARLTTLKLPPKQLAALKHLAHSPRQLTPAELAEGVGCTAAPITALRRKGLIRSEARRVRQAEPEPAAAPREQNLQLNRDQRAALETILAALQSSHHQTVLLHGVTGSGKTEVYLQAIQEVVSYGRQAIVLVPEISLTPQTRQRFRSRFDRVAVLHSHLSDVERHRHWERIAAGEVEVVVGARSAVFAPTPHLGLIVIDEEHETSFKQDSAPRYHAREVARYRAETERVPLVLGSATPSLESWHDAARGKTALIELPQRVMDLPLPDVQTIDLRISGRDRRDRGAISRQLHLAMQQTLQESGQVILLLNRRGFSTHIQCPACGTSVACPRCEIDLTYHKSHATALCHYCDFERPLPRQCEKCGFEGIRHSGIGTQRLEAEVRARFPNHRCLRMDTDTMRKPGSHEQALERFCNAEIDILLGTQMIAKGLDFPNVMLVGVVNADMALHLPDFRASERTFQLVTQVAGRTGRGVRGGRVLVQTYEPEHPAILAALRHDYALFAAGELPQRQSLHYPPWACLARLVVRSPRETQARVFAEGLAGRLAEAIGELQDPHARVLGPAPAPIPKLNEQYRFNIQVHAGEGEALRRAVSHAIAGIKEPEEVQWIVDIDPLNML